MFRSSSSRRRALAFIASTLVAAGILASATSGAIAQESATPVPWGWSRPRKTFPNARWPRSESLPEGMDAATVYAIVPEESKARYRVQEELAQVGANEAVGETQAIARAVWLRGGRAAVALLPLRRRSADAAKRSGEARQLPLQEYARGGEVPAGDLCDAGGRGDEQATAEGQETTLRLIGDLTLRDVTKLVAWEAKSPSTTAR